MCHDTGMVDAAPPNETEIVGTPETSSRFSETYHVQGLHREMLASIDDVNAPQRIWDRHSASYQDYGVPSPRLGRDVDDQQVWDAFVITFVLNQDLSVIRTMQTGLHQPGLTRLTLSGEECRIINMNHHLERFLSLEPGGTEPA